MFSHTPKTKNSNIDSELTTFSDFTFCFFLFFVALIETCVCACVHAFIKLLNKNKHAWFKVAIFTFPHRRRPYTNCAKFVKYWFYLSLSLYLKLDSIKCHWIDHTQHIISASWSSLLICLHMILFCVTVYACVCAYDLNFTICYSQRKICLDDSWSMQIKMWRQMGKT